MVLFALRHSEQPLCEPWLDRFVLLKNRRVWKWPAVRLRDTYERSTRALSLTLRSRCRWLLRVALLGFRRRSAQSNVGYAPLVGIEYRSSGNGGNEGSVATTCRSASDRRLPTATQGSSRSLLAGGERTGVGPRDVMIKQAPERKERDLDDGDRTAVAVLMWGKVTGPRRTSLPTLWSCSSRPCVTRGAAAEHPGERGQDSPP